MKPLKTTKHGFPPASMVKTACRACAAATLGLAAWTGQARAAATLIANNFDGVANDIGPAFQSLSNGVGTGGSGDPATGTITTGTGSVNSARGLNNVSLVTIPIGTTSITANFVVSSAPAAVSNLIANGLFFGMVSGSNATSNVTTGLYNNDPRAFGYIAGSTAWGDHGTGQDLDQNNNTIFTQLPAIPTDASFADGFTVSITMNSNDTWSMVTTGLSTNATGTGGYAGALSTGAGGFDFNTFITGGVGLYTSLQNSGQSLDLASVSLTAVPEPSTGTLAGLCVAGMLVIRRRGTA